MIPKLAIIVATRNRAKELRNLLTNIGRQSHLPNRIIIVDSSEVGDEKLVGEFPRLSIAYFRYSLASASRQRNFGLTKIGPEIQVVGFLDDDSLLEPDSLRIVLEYLARSSSTLAGVSLNMVNHPMLAFELLKHTGLAERLGIYSRRGGMVLPSGFQTMIGRVREETHVQWLPSCAVFWKTSILEEYRFDEWYSDYSYLEDLDLSYRIGKKYDLVVIAEAGYQHLPSPAGRIGGFRFGKKEVLNRVYFVRKNPELSVAKCFLALGARAGLSFVMFLRCGDPTFLQRILGNFVGIGTALFMKINE